MAVPTERRATEGLRIALQRSYSGFGLKVDLRLPGRGVTALFGHSGSGKTTVLRCVAGLERATSAFVSVNGQIWQDDASGAFVPVYKRALGYVFQEASLFPHLTVRKNLDYGQRRVPAASRRVSFDQAIDLLGIEHLLDRAATGLSGGERQRVAIARALLTSPDLLLLDEPLAALDLKRKKEILPYLERMHDELETPILFVSHSPDEVAQLADYLVLMEEGSVVADGPLLETLARLDLPAAFADDAGVVLDTVIGEQDDVDNLTRLDFAGGSLYVGERPAPVGRRVRCRVHARDVSLTLERAEDTSILNILSAKVVGVGRTEIPGHVLVRLVAGGTPFLARITQRSCHKLGIEPGLPVWAQIKAVALLD